MKKMVLVVVSFLTLAAAATAEAQSSQIYFPGSVWTANGTLSPIEKGNVQSITHLEQGIAYKGFELFTLFEGQADTKGLDWNRRLKTGLGARLTQGVATGAIRFSVAYVREKRFVLPRVAEGWQIGMDAWFGWNQKPGG